MAEPVATPTVEHDPWEDDQFAPIDTRTGPEHFASELADIANAELPPTEEVVDPVAAPVETTVEPVAVAPKYAEQEIVAVEGGGTVIYEEDDQGWHATLKYKEGEPIEVFHARTPLELSKQLAVGKLNASKKINQLNKQVKLKPVQKVDTPKPATTAVPTAEQLFEIKTMAQTDLYGAFDKMLQVTAGVNFSDFVAWARQGKEASEQLRNQEIVRQWSERVNYHRTPNNDEAIGKYLDEHNLQLTVENLVKAHGDLLEAGLLEEASKPTPKPQPVPQPAATPAAPVAVAPPPVVPAAPARIERPVGRANATLGLRVGETSNVRPQPEPKVPSAEELDELPTGDIEQLFAAVRRTKAQQSARR